MQTNVNWQFVQFEEIYPVNQHFRAKSKNSKIASSWPFQIQLENI